MRIFIGPIDAAKDTPSSSEITKTTFKKAVNPTKLKLNVQRIKYAPQNAIVVEGEGLDPNVFRNCPAFVKAGLGVKDDTKLNPRLIVHDIPVEFTKEEIAECIVEQNLPDAQVDDIEIVYLYPKGNKELRTRVIEVKPDHGITLRSKQKLYISWAPCRVADHLIVKQ